MRRSEAATLHDQAGYYQYSADALCDMRTAAAPLIAEHITTTPNYHSWMLAGALTLLHITDKVDGRLAKTRDRIITRMVADSPTHTLDQRLVDAIANGGRKDDKADKALTHSVFGAVAIREAANGNTAYAAAIAGSDLTMFARDDYVGKQRDKAATNGIKGDARQLGKIKQTILVITQVAAVSPLARPKEHGEGFSFGRAAVVVGMAGGTALSLYSGFDQITSLRQQHDNLTVSDQPSLISAAPIEIVQAVSPNELPMRWQAPHVQDDVALAFDKVFGS